jgi:hypothetical protein
MIADDNPITAITRDHVRSRRFPDGDSLDRLLHEAKHQFLEAKRRYLMLRELAKMRRVRLRAAAGPSPTRPMSAWPGECLGERNQSADVSRAELNHDGLRLHELKEVIRLREIRLGRQERGHRLRDRYEAAQRRRHDPELRDNVLRLRKLKELLQLRQLLSFVFRYFFVASRHAAVYKNQAGRASATNTGASLTNVT